MPIPARVISWFKKLIDAWKAKRYRDGYEWAANFVLNEGDLKTAEGYISLSRHFGSFDEFDRGALAAMEYLRPKIR